MPAAWQYEKISGVTAQEEAARLAAVQALGLIGAPREERFERITRLAARLFGVDAAMINLVGRDRQWAVAETGAADLVDIPREESFCTVTVERPEQLVVEDAQADDRFASTPLVVGDRIRFYAGQPVTGPGGERVGALCLVDDGPRYFTESDRALLADLAEWVERELANDEELERAASVQRGLVPSRVPDLKGWDLAGACVPARQVGGDLCDWYPVPGGLGITVADVMGKGLAAAIVMASLRAVLRTGARQGDLAGAVDASSTMLGEDFAETGGYATLLHARVDLRHGYLGYVDAGHGLALVVRGRGGGDAERLPVRGLPAGAWPEATWEEGVVHLERGDALVVYSDGLLDLHPDRASVDAAAVEAVRTTATAEEAVELLLRPARATSSRPDDVTVVVLRRAA